MRSIHVKTVADVDGELHLSNLPVHKGDAVEAIVLMPDGMTDECRRRAREEFLEHARSASFRSSGPYPSREELHERH
jgi:hypothetical protein